MKYSQRSDAIPLSFNKSLRVKPQEVYDTCLFYHIIPSELKQSIKQNRILQLMLHKVFFVIDDV